MLIKMVFYVLKKKMISKFVAVTAKNSWTIDSVYEIYNVMTNLYLSWENVLMVQMTAEDPGFF